MSWGEHDHAVDVGRRPAAPSGEDAPPLDVLGLLSRARLLVFGATGFLGKVWLSLVLARIPDVHVYLVVRPKGGMNAEQRFWADVASSGVFGPLREAHADYEGFMKARVTPIAGDVSQDFAGVAPEVRESIRGKLTAVVNVAGVVDFNPPLDQALGVNALGMQHLVQLARDLGEPPFLHTSTCFVAGMATGPVPETDPRQRPYPFFGQLPGAPWDPEREIAECVTLIADVRRRANDASQEARYRRQALDRLQERGEPCGEAAVVAAVAELRRRDVDDELAQR